MKLLVDNNVSFRVARQLAYVFEGSAHVEDFNLGDRTEDSKIWDFAKQNGFTIFTKDNDFEAMSRLFGCPPKVIQLTCGNVSTKVILTLIEKHVSTITAFISDNENCLLYLG